MKLYKTNKKVISIKNNPAKFLNGITANVLDAPRNAFCDIHGKIIATFDQIKINEDEFWIVLEADFVDPTLGHIDKYAKLSGVVIEKLDKIVYFDIEKGADLTAEVNSIEQKAGQLILSAKELEANVSEEEFALFRLKNNIPIQGIDYKNDFLLNIGMDEFVSLTKGCFLGQEPISKVYNRSKPTWQLVVKYADDCSEEEKDKMTSKITEPDSHRDLGFVFTKNS